MLTAVVPWSNRAACAYLSSMSSLFVVVWESAGSKVSRQALALAVVEFRILE